MQSQRWLESVREQLVARRLPRDYIERFMDELADHFYDLTIQNLTEESMQSEDEAIIRLGDPQQLARAAAKAYRRRTFLGRHPAVAFLLFAVTPFFSVVATIVAELWVLLYVVPEDGFLFPEKHRYLGLEKLALESALSFAFIIAPTILVVALYYQLAKRTAALRLWLAISCVGAFIVGYITHFDVRFSAKLRSTYLGLYVNQRPGLLQCVQCAFPIAICCWLAWKHRKPSPTQIKNENVHGCEHARAVA